MVRREVAVRVLEPGSHFLEPGPEKVVGCLLTHDRFPGFVFQLDWLVSTGTVIVLAIFPSDMDNPPPEGIRSTDLRRGLPFNELRLAARRAWADSVDELPDDVGFREVDASGRVIRSGRTKLDPETRRRLKASGRTAAKESKGGRPPAYTELDLVKLLDRYVQWVKSGKTVGAFLKKERLSADALDYRKQRAEDLELFVRGKRRGNPHGAHLTAKGQELLDEGGEW
jgi:hypothetical protein